MTDTTTGLWPEDRDKGGLYWVRQMGRGWVSRLWLPDTQKWLDLGVSIAPAPCAKTEMPSGPVYIPTPDEAPATLDDRRPPEWTLKEPGVLVHRGGRHTIDWRPEWHIFAVTFRSSPDPMDGYDIGDFPTLDEAKAAAEQHVAWCAEFGQ